MRNEHPMRKLSGCHCNQEATKNHFKLNEYSSQSFLTHCNNHHIHVHVLEKILTYKFLVLGCKLKFNLLLYKAAGPSDWKNG